MTRRKPGEVQQLMVQLASRPDGMSCRDLAEVLGSKPTDASPRIGKAMKQGQLFPVLCGFQMTRWFASQAQADAWAAVNQARYLAMEAEKVAESKRRRAASKLALNRKSWEKRKAEGYKTPKKAPTEKKAKPAELATVTIKARPAFKTAEADYSRAKFTRAPSIRFDPRYQVDPASTPFGAGFSSIGIGRSVTTGRAWA